jgi:hypothetical protein
VSGRDGVEPPTEIKRHRLAAGADGFADAEIVEEMFSGLRDDTALERGTLLCAPHVSALRFLAVAEEKIAANVTKGWAFEGELPAWPIRASPYGIVDESERAGKPKFRLTIDLSWPPPGALPSEYGCVESFNDSMDTAGWPANKLMRVSQVAEAAAILRLHGGPVSLWGLDGKSYYRVIGRQRSQHWRNAMAVDGGFQVDERCCFGSKADAVKCSRVSNFLAFNIQRELDAFDAAHPPVDPAVIGWLDRRRLAAEAAGFEGADALRFTRLYACGIYIDDAGGASIDDLLYDTAGRPVVSGGVHMRRAQRHFEIARATFEWFGFTSEPSKEQPPCTRAVMLGVELDVLEGWMRLDGAKRSRYCKRVQAALDAPSLRRRELIQLLGRLQFAATCYPRGRQWLCAAWRLSRTHMRTKTDVLILTRHVRADLRRWIEMLELDDALAPGVPLACVDVARAADAPGVGVMYADASGVEYGWAAWTLVGNEVLMVHAPWSQAELVLGIAEKELFASSAGLLTLASWGGWRNVVNYTDNMVALSAMRSSAPSTPRLQELVRARGEAMRLGGLREAAERVGSKSNLWADLGSRGRVDDVRRQAIALGFSFRCVPVLAEWASPSWLLDFAER